MTATIVHEDTRTDAEKRYDALKDGSAYVKEDERITLAREADRLLADDIIDILEEIDGGEADSNTILIEPMYDNGGNYTDKPVGPLGWTDFILGACKSRVILCVDGGAGAAGVDPIVVIGNEDTDLTTEDAIQLAHNILAIAADPRFQAARGQSASPTVQAQYLYPDPEDEDDYTTTPNGALSHVRFERKDATLIIEANGEASYLALGNSSICQLKALKALPDLVAILADPRVQALNG